MPRKKKTVGETTVKEQEPISEFQKNADATPRPSAEADDTLGASQAEAFRKEFVNEDIEQEALDALHEDDQEENLDAAEFVGGFGGKADDDDQPFDVDDNALDAELLEDGQSDAGVTASEELTEEQKISNLDDQPLSKLDTLAVNDVVIFESHDILTVQQLLTVTSDVIAEWLEVSTAEADAIKANASQFLRITAGILEEIDADDQGNAFLPGVKPLVNKKLEEYGRDVKVKRDAMADAREAYTKAEELLRVYMKKEGVAEYKLESGDTVYIDITEKAKITKKKKAVEDEGEWL